MSTDLSTEIAVETTVNGQRVRRTVEARRMLLDFVRDDLGLKGTKRSCDSQVCGACTVLVDGATVRACLMFAVQAQGAEVTTVEGLAADDGELSVVQVAFREAHGLQCGFCTPGFVVTVTALLEENPAPSDAEIREALSGNLCRCTGYQGILAAVRQAATSPSSAAEGNAPIPR